MAALLFATLNGDKAVSIASFAIGFNQHVTVDQHTLQYPLSSLAAGTIFGALTYIGGSFIGGIMPRKLRFMIPTLATISIGYYKYREINKFYKTYKPVIIKDNS